MVATADLPGDQARRFPIVGVGGQCATFDHRHPGFALHYQAAFKCQANGIATALNTGLTLILIKILDGIPRQLIGVFEGLYQPLLLQLGQLTCVAQRNRLVKFVECCLKILQALLPANVLWVVSGNALSIALGTEAVYVPRLLR